MEWSDLKRLHMIISMMRYFLPPLARRKPGPSPYVGGIGCSYLQDISTAYIFEEFKIALHECENYFHDRRIG